MYISEIKTGAPTDVRCPLERRMYETLDKLRIPYERVDNDPAASMEECAEVDKVLGTEIRKMCSYVTRKRQHFSCLSCRQINPLTQQLSVRNWVYPICHLHRRRKCLSILERHRDQPVWQDFSWTKTTMCR